MTSVGEVDELRESLKRLFPDTIFFDTLYHDGKAFPLEDRAPVRTPRSHFKIEALGHLMPESAPPTPFWVGFRIKKPEASKGLIAVLWRTRIYVLDRSPEQFSETHWRPGWTDTVTTYHGMEDATLEDVQALWRADQVVRRGLRYGGGRKKLEDSDPTWRALTVSALELKAAHPGWSWRRIVRRLFGSENVESNERTLRRWRDKLAKITAG